jgi:cation diffusion facilitator CzcD-associated flavoprotein CzcO
VKPNVEPVYGGIKEIVPEGIVTEDGNLHKFDILVCATGFNVAFRPAFKLINGSGQTLDQDWGDGVNLYLGVSAPRFPNYYTIVVSILASLPLPLLFISHIS